MAVAGQSPCTLRHGPGEDGLHCTFRPDAVLAHRENSAANIAQEWKERAQRKEGWSLTRRTAGRGGDFPSQILRLLPAWDSALPSRGDDQEAPHSWALYLSASGLLKGELGEGQGCGTRTLKLEEIHSENRREEAGSGQGFPGKGTR